LALAVDSLPQSIEGHSDFTQFAAGDLEASGRQVAVRSAQSSVQDVWFICDFQSRSLRENLPGTG
jgi:hypothetical protein